YIPFGGGWSRAAATKKSPAEAGLLFTTPGGGLLAEAVLRFQVHGTTQDVVVVVVPRRAAGAGVVAGLVVGHLVGEVVHHQREGQVIRGTPVDAGVVGDVRAPLAGLGAAGVDVVVALARIREVARGRADAVRVQG